MTRLTEHHGKRLHKMILSGDYDDELREHLKKLYEDWDIPERTPEQRIAGARKRTLKQKPAE